VQREGVDDWGGGGIRGELREGKEELKTTPSGYLLRTLYVSSCQLKGSS